MKYYKKIPIIIPTDSEILKTNCSCAVFTSKKIILEIFFCDDCMMQRILEIAIGRVKIIIEAV